MSLALINATDASGLGSKNQCNSSKLAESGEPYAYCCGKGPFVSACADVKRYGRWPPVGLLSNQDKSHMAVNPELFLENFKAGQGPSSLEFYLYLFFKLY
jgi:hypothetical protein